MKSEYSIVTVSRRRWFRMQYWFRIVHENGETIATSETYSSVQARDDSALNMAKAFGLLVIRL